MRLLEGLKNARGLGLLKEAGKHWLDDRAPRMGAAISYYTVFSLAPLMLISIALAGVVLGADEARTGIVGAMGSLVGEVGGKAIENIVESAGRNHDKGLLASIAGVLMLLVGASGVFIELQDSLNSIWGVEAKPGTGLWGFIRHRLLSFAMVLAIGFLLLVSLIISAILGAVGAWMSSALPGGEVLWQVVNLIVGYAITTVLFGMIFKLLPDVKLSWRDVWIGAAFTSLLFSLGKLGIGMYLGKSGLATAYGAAASLAIIFIWVYYSAQILLFGAEFTKVYAHVLGSLAHSSTEEAVKDHAVPVENATGAANRPEEPSAIRGALVDLV